MLAEYFNEHATLCEIDELVKPVGSDRFASICVCGRRNWKVDSMLRKHPNKSSCVLVCILESILPLLVVKYFVHSKGG